MLEIAILEQKYLVKIVYIANRFTRVRMEILLIYFCYSIQFNV